ncbi:MAG: hypothetical protein KGL41_02415 [Actinomycetales bacterium]|nr:hypothetical protein [Actinomycetales bacterium]
MKLSLGSIVLQRIFTYLSIQAITALEYYHFWRSDSVQWAGWVSLISLPRHLPTGVLMLAGGYPDVWAWVFVLVVRAIRRRKFTPGAWSPRWRKFALTVVTVLFVWLTVAFILFRQDFEGTWWTVALAGLALPLLFLPVFPKKKSETVEASSNQVEP